MNETLTFGNKHESNIVPDSFEANDRKGTFPRAV